MQNILTAGALISKLLWPSATPGMPEPDRAWMLRRCRTLRKAMSARSGMALERRGTRNGFEHFDERLDKIVRGGTLPVVDFNLGPAGSIRVVGQSAGSSQLRSIDPGNFDVSILGDSVNIQALISEIEELGEAADRWGRDYHDRHFPSRAGGGPLSTS